MNLGYGFTKKKVNMEFVAQLLKNLPAVPETPVCFLDQENPLEK